MKFRYLSAATLSLIILCHTHINAPGQEQSAPQKASSTSAATDRAPRPTPAPTTGATSSSASTWQAIQAAIYNTVQTALANANTDNIAATSLTLQGDLTVNGTTRLSTGLNGFLQASSGTVSATGSSQIQTADIADSAVTQPKIADGAVTTDKLAADTVTESKIADGAVTASKIGTGAVGTTKIADSAVTTLKLADNAVTNDKILNGTIGVGKLGSGVVQTDNIATGAVTTDQLGALTVTASKIASNTITNTQIADTTIELAKLASDAAKTTNTANTLVLRGSSGEFAAGATTLGGLTVSGTSQLTGNVGIGAASGSEKLLVTGTMHVTGATGIDGNLTVGGTTVVQTPTQGNQAATKNYVDTFAQGLKAKEACNALADHDIVLYGEQTIDGVAVTAGQRVLTIAQGNAVYNGIWEVTASHTWIRPTDFGGDPGSMSAKGAYTFMLDGGTQYGLTGWVCEAESGHDTIGTNTLQFSQFNQVAQVTMNNLGTTGYGVYANQSGTVYNFKRVNAGDNISITDNTDYLTIAALGTSANTGDTLVKRDGSGNFAAGTITADGLNTAAVTVTALGTGLVRSSSGSLTNGTVAAGEIGAGAVTESSLASGAVTETKIGTGAITTTKIASNAVTEVNIVNGAVTTNKIGAGAVTGAKIASATITADNLAASSVTETQIADSAVTANKIGTGAVTTTKISDLNVTTGKIADTAVTSGKIATGAVGTTQLADASVTGAKIANTTITAGNLATNAVTEAKIINGAVTGTKIADATITLGKLVTSAYDSADTANALVLRDSHGNFAAHSTTFADLTVTSTSKLTGNVGIGMAPGANALAVSGAANVSGTATVGNLVVNGTANVQEPTQAAQAATKNYVDMHTNGLVVKSPCNALAASNITLSGAQTIDHVAVTTGNRVLAIAQGNPVYNGIWQVSSTGTWTRPSDFASGAARGAYSLITTGSTYANTGWICTSSAGYDIIGTNSLVFTQFSSPGTVEMSNTGTTGQGWYKDQTGNTFNFKRVNAGDNVTITDHGDYLTLSARGGSSDIINIDNVGTGTGIYKGVYREDSTNTYYFRSLKDSANISITKTNEEKELTIATKDSLSLAGSLTATGLEISGTSTLNNLEVTGNTTLAHFSMSGTLTCGGLDVTGTLTVGSLTGLLRADSGYVHVQTAQFDTADIADGAITLTKIATSATSTYNQASRLVLRDSFGNFKTGAITATGLSVSGTTTITGTTTLGSLTGLLRADSGIVSATAVPVVDTANIVDGAVTLAKINTDARKTTNTADTLVQRDAFGGFGAGTVTATGLAVSGTATITGTTTLGSLNGYLQATSGVISATTIPIINTDNIADGAITTEKLASGIATPLATPNLIVQRDGSGNFATNAITAAELSGVTGIDTAGTTNLQIGTTGSYIGIGGAAVTGNALAVTGNTNIGGTMTVQTQSGTPVTVASITATQATFGPASGTYPITLQGSTNTITGTTNINTTGSGTTNIGTSSNTGTVTIGNSSNTVTIAGATNTITGTTNINATGTANTQIGSAALNHVGIGTTAAADYALKVSGYTKIEGDTTIAGTATISNLDVTGTASFNSDLTVVDDSGSQFAITSGPTTTFSTAAATGNTYIAGTLEVGNSDTSCDTTSLTVHGKIKNSTGSIETGATCNASDARIKKDIETLDTQQSLKTINQLRPVWYRHTPEWLSKTKGANTVNVGLIAQEAQHACPEIVMELSEKDQQGNPLYGIDYSKLAPHLVAATQQLSAQIDSLEHILHELQKTEPKQN